MTHDDACDELLHAIINSLSSGVHRQTELSCSYCAITDFHRWQLCCLCVSNTNIKFVHIKLGPTYGIFCKHLLCMARIMSLWQLVSFQ